MNHTTPPATTERLYQCPMHPEVKQDRPGRCPECGMQLLPIATSTPHERATNKHVGHSTAAFLQKFWVCLLLSIPLIIYSDLPMELFAWQAPTFPGSVYLQIILGSVIFFYGGAVFLQSAWRELRGRLPGMMTLISLAITAAYAFSIYATLSGASHTMFWELGSLITIMLLGHWLEMRAVSGVGRALEELSALIPDTAEVVRGGVTSKIPLAELRVDDVVIVRPGSTIPADGEITEGTSDVNESMITGESKAVTKSTGAMVRAGTINGDGGLKLVVKFIGEETYLAGVVRLVKEAQNSKSNLQILSDRVAFYLTIIAVSVGAATFVVWILLGAGTLTATERLVAVLVATCPHALGLAVPLVASISTTMAARNGFLIKQRLALESARTITAVLFDKTGTLTTGTFGITDITPNTAAGFTAHDVLRLAASVNNSSEHSLAKAMVAEAQKQNLVLETSTDFQRIPGKGSRAIVTGNVVIVGSPLILQDNNLSLSAPLQQAEQKFSAEGKTVIYVITEKNVVGSIALADLVRSESKEAVQALQKRGITVAMITGDSSAVAAWVARQLGITEYFAQVLPEQKSAKVKLLQSKGLRVAMVGDGVNDAPALTQADVGIAIGAGTNVAIESAGIILAKNDPRDIIKIIRLSELTYRKMMQNLFWATGYNVIMIPLSAGVLASRGIIVQPALAALVMSLSTIIVAFNALLLKRQKID